MGGPRVSCCQFRRRPPELQEGLESVQTWPYSPYPSRAPGGPRKAECAQRTKYTTMVTTATAFRPAAPP